MGSEGVIGDSIGNATDSAIGGSRWWCHWWVPWVEPLGGSTGGFYWWVPLVVPLVVPFLDVICPAPRDPTDAHPHGRKLSKALSIPHIPSLGMFADTALLSSAVLLSSQHNAQPLPIYCYQPIPVLR